MKKPGSTQIKKSALRSKAEEEVNLRAGRSEEMSSNDINELIHELDVHQVELEMQNEDLRESEIKLADALASLTDLYDFAPSGYFTISEKGFIIKLNLTGAKMLQRERSTLANNLFSNFIHKDDHKVWYLHRKKLLEEREELFCELRLIRDDKTHLWVRLDSRIKIDPGTDNRVIQTDIVDISEKKRDEEALRRSNQWFSAIFEGSLDAIFITDPEGSFVDVNFAAEELTGYTKDELLTMSVPELHMKEDQIAYDQNFTEIMEGKDMVTESIILRRDKGLVPNEFSNRSIKIGDKIFMHTVARDITERHRSEQIVRSSEAKFRSLVTLSPAGIYLTDRDGKCLFVNPAWCRMAGMEPEEALGDGWIEAIHHDDRSHLFELWNAFASGRDGWSHEYRFCSKNGEVTWVYGSAEPIRDGEGMITGYLGSNTDITRHKEAEEMLKESETRYRTLFEHSPIPILEEDFSEIRKSLNILSKRGVRDFRAYFSKRPDRVAHFASLVRIADINQTSLAFFGVQSRKEMEDNLTSYFPLASLEVFKEEIIALAEGRNYFNSELDMIMPTGEVKRVHLYLNVIPGYMDTLGRVLVSWTDISDRARYEAMLKKRTEDFRELAIHIEDAREDERVRIAMDLHDDLGQKLTALKMDISWIRNRIGIQSGIVDNKMDGVLELIDDTIGTVQRISAGLRPSILTDLGIVSAIEWQVGEFRKMTGTTITMKTDIGDFSPDNKLSITLFRILQESLTNITRHARATRVSVRLKLSGSKLTMAIRDNGIGIEEEKLESSSSFGLMAMRERARTVGGKMIFRVLKEGTEILISIPV